MRCSRHVALPCVAALVMAAAAVGCGGDDGTATSTTTGPVTTTTVAPAGTTAHGFLVAVGAGSPRLCEVLLESYPPQCGGPSTTVEGLDLAEVNGVTSGGDVRWTDRSISLLGDLTGDVLHVPLTATGSTIVGRATAGPVCPVEQNPPDPACADRSVEGATIRVSGTTTVDAVTDATGRYAVRVQPGAYAVEAQPVAGLLGTPAPVSVTVGASPVTVDLSYDTGIR